MLLLLAVTVTVYGIAPAKGVDDAAGPEGNGAPTTGDTVGDMVIEAADVGIDEPELNRGNCELQRALSAMLCMCAASPCKNYLVNADKLVEEGNGSVRPLRDGSPVQFKDEDTHYTFTLRPLAASLMDKITVLKRGSNKAQGIIATGKINGTVVYRKYMILNVRPFPA